MTGSTTATPRTRPADVGALDRPLPAAPLRRASEGGRAFVVVEAQPYYDCPEELRRYLVFMERDL